MFNQNNNTMKRLFQSLVLVVLMALPWLSFAQFSTYNFNTGVDQSRWIQLSTAAWDTTMPASGSGDSFKTPVQSIGFSFEIGGTAYTQFSMNSDGCLRLGSTEVGTSYYTTPFNATNAAQNNPKIIGIGRDGRMRAYASPYADLGCYLKYEVVGTAPNRVLVAEFNVASYTTTIQCIQKWQVQLHETSNAITIVYDAAPTENATVGYQVGLCTNASDVVTVYPVSHMASLGATTTLAPAASWPGQGRYYEFTPSTCPTPAPSLVARTDNSATFSWAAGNASQYNIEYGPSGFVRGTGTTDVVTTTGCTITGLDANTAYDFYLQSYCSATDTGGWIGLPFLTEVSTISTYPYLENFDSYAGSTSGATNNLPNGWFNVNTGTSTTYIGYPIIYSTASYAQSTPNSLRFYTYYSGTTYSDQIAVTPQFDNVSNLQIQFAARCGSSSYTSTSKLAIGICEGNNTFVWIDTVDVDAVTYQTFEVPLNSYTGSGNRIAICGIKPASSYCNINVDDIQVYPIPNCVAPNNVVADNITGEQATISWTERGNATNWIVYYDTVQFDPNSSESTTYLTEFVSGNPTITLSNLEPSTQYYAYVVSDCGSETSPLAAFGFRTACAAMELPYSYGFEDLATGSAAEFNPCWNKLTNYTTSYPYISATSPHNGGKNLYFYATTTYYSCAILPPAPDNVSDLTVAFWSRSSSTSYTGALQVGVMTNPADISTFTLVQTVQPNGTTWTHQEVDLSSYTGTGLYIALLNPNTATNYVYVDDIEVYTTPTCDHPENFVTTAITNESADLTWTPVGDATTWVIEYADSLFTPGQGLGELVYATDTTYTIDNLNANTTYYVFLHSDCGGGDVSNDIQLTFHTACEPILNEDLPYTHGFEGLAASSTSPIDPCWNKGTNYTTAYPYVSTTYPHSGSNALYFYATTAYYSYAVMPMFDDSLSNLMLTFWSRSSSTSYTGAVQVGVMSDPNDISTFTSVATCTPNGTTYTRHSVAFGDYHGNGRYIAILNPNTATNYVYVDDVVVDVKPTCPSVTSVEATNITGTTAVLGYTYTEGILDTVPEMYQIILTNLDDNSEDEIIATSNPYLLSGLNPSTPYKAVVSVICDNGDTYGNADSVNFSTGCLLGGVVEITGGTASTSYYIPASNFYNFSYTEQLILADEIGAVDSILGIAFEYQYSTPITAKNNVSIYLAHTEMATNTGWVPRDSMQLVYTGAFSFTQGWNTVNFDSAFVYNGHSNLMICVDDNSGSYGSSSQIYAVHSITGRTRYYQSDSDNPSAITGPTSVGTTYGYRNNMKLITPCINDVSCIPPSAMVSSIGSTTATIDWVAGYMENSWNLDYRAQGDTAWIPVLQQTSANTHTLTGLTPATAYQARIAANCVTGDVAYGYVSFTTSCAEIATFPYAENFDNYGTGATEFPNCWTRLSTTANRPYINTNGYTGNYLYFYAAANGYSMAILPALDTTVKAANELMVSFKGKLYSTSYIIPIEVGVMTDPEDHTTFVPVGSYLPSSTNWEDFRCNLMGYQGNGAYIAIRVGASAASYSCVDNFVLDTLPSCVFPSMGQVTGITNTDATIHWVGNTGNYEVVYGPAGFDIATEGTHVTVVDDSLALTGLNGNTAYDVYVRSICSATEMSSYEMITFRTACQVLTNADMPWFENFDDVLGTTSTTGANNLPACWDRINNGTSYTSYPIVYNSSTYALSGSNSMRFYIWYSGTAYDEQTALLPEMTDVQNLQITFSARTSTSTYVNSSKLAIGVKNVTTGNIQWLDTVTVDTIGYREYEIPLNGYSSFDNGQIAIRGIKPASDYCVVTVDDISVDIIPTCIRPINLTASNATSNSVQLGWTDRAGASLWEIEYGNVGFADGNGTRVVANSNPFVLTNVPSSMDAEYRVRAICNASDSGQWSTTRCRFATAQNPASIPYNYDFENVTEWNSWQTNSNNTTNWYRGTAAAAQGQYGAYVSADAGATVSHTAAITNVSAYRDIDFGTIDSSFTLTFKAKAGGSTANFYDGLMVFLVDPAVPVVASTSSITTPWGSVNDLHRLATVRLDTNWSTYTASLDTISGVHRVAFFWFNQSNQDSFIGEAAAIDDIHIDYTACVRPVNIRATHANASSIALTWDGPQSAQYDLCYRKVGAAVSTNQWLSLNTNSAVLTGLDNLTDYYVWVRKICGADTSRMSDATVVSTLLCDGAIYDTIGDVNSTGTSYNNPVNNFYKYCVSETIIDSAELAVLGSTEIISVAYEYAYTTASTAKTNVSIYMANTSVSSFATSSDIVAKDSTWKLVYTGNLNCEEGWNMFRLDSSFTWDGHSNLMIIVDDNSGAYGTSSQVFRTTTTTSNKTLVYYSDTYDPDVNNLSNSYSGSKTITLFRTNTMLIGCQGNSCAMPIISNITKDYANATITWVGDATDYEVEMKPASQAAWSENATAVQDHSYTFTALNPSTDYMFRVRAICDAVEGFVSEWTYGAFTTDSLPCFAPSAVTATPAGTSVDLDWTNGGNETQWVVKVWNTAFADSVVVSAKPYTFQNLTSGTQYYAAVAAYCGNGAVVSDWSDAVSFTTTVCTPVTNVAASNVTNSSAKIAWTSNSDAAEWEVTYGTQGFGQGEGTTVTVTAPEYTINGLYAETSYDVYVRAICGTNYISEWSEKVTFTTSNVGINEVSGLNVNIYPNPATTATTITLSGMEGEVEVSIVDMTGRKVMNEKMECAGDCVKTINVDNLAQGAYFVRIQANGTNMVKKLIVK